MDEPLRTRIDVRPTLAPVRIRDRIMNELCQHALETRPEECCGLLTGKGDDRFARVYRCRNDMTARHRSDPATFPRDGTQAYFMNEVDYLRAQTEAEQRGEEVTAVYHSHVGASVHFSAMDQEFAEHAFFPFPDAAQIVLAVGDVRVSGAGIFERDPATGMFVGTPLEVAPS